MPDTRENNPDFIVIGAMKAGTTSLQHYLNEHPDIAMAPKELNFFAFDEQWQRGVDWYRAHFRNDAKVRGEISPGYAKRQEYPDAAQRMHEAVPDARIVYVVREPLARIRSHWMHTMGADASGRPAAEILEANLEHFIDTSRYMYQLEPYVRLFGRDRILVLTAEQLRENRAESLARLFGFIGADPDFAAARFDREHHSSAVKVRRNPFGRLMARVPMLRALEGAAKRAVPQRYHRSMGRLLGARLTLPDFSSEVVNRINSELCDDMDRLRSFTGQALPGWPTVGPGNSTSAWPD